MAAYLDRPVASASCLVQKSALTLNHLWPQTFWCSLCWHLFTVSKKYSFSTRLVCQFSSANSYHIVLADDVSWSTDQLNTILMIGHCGS